eukprot:4916530-Ditylum_brightwellii.AAC.1
MRCENNMIIRQDITYNERRQDTTYPKPFLLALVALQACILPVCILPVCVLHVCILPVSILH